MTMNRYTIAYRTPTGRTRQHRAEATSLAAARDQAVTALGIDFAAITGVNVKVTAVEREGQIVALFRDPLDAFDYWNARPGTIAQSWSVPAETFEFEGE